MDEPLTADQQRLYERLQDHCAKEHMWVGNGYELAQFAGLAYPFDPDIFYGLVKRNLVKHNSICWYALTIVG